MCDYKDQKASLGISNTMAEAKMEPLSFRIERQIAQHVESAARLTKALEFIRRNPDSEEMINNLRFL